MKRLTSTLAALAMLAVVAVATPAAAEPEPEVSVDPFETYIASTFETDSDNRAIAVCDSDTDNGIFDVAVGGGVLSPGGVESPKGRKFVVQQSYPLGAGGVPNGWVGVHRSINTGGVKSDIEVFAVCLRVKVADGENPSIPDDYPFDPLNVYVAESEVSDDGAATARCAADDLAAGGGGIANDRYALKRSFPVKDSDTAAAWPGQRPNGWRVTARSVVVGDPPGTVQAFAVCIPLLRDSLIGPVGGPPINDGVRPPQPGDFDMHGAYIATGNGFGIADAFCDDGDVAFGGGGHAVINHQKQALKYMIPAPNEDGLPIGWNTATRHVDETTQRNVQNAGYAICVPVAE